MKLSEVLKKVLPLAEAIRDYWDRELPKRHPDYPLENPGEESGPPPPEEQELRDFLASLPGEMVYKVATVASLWRAGPDLSRLGEEYQALEEMFEYPEMMISYLVETGALADQLIDALAELKKRKINVDKLNFAPAKARK
jgi:hypothetical protein